MCGSAFAGQWSPIIVVAAIVLNIGTIMLVIAVASKPWITGNDSRPDDLEFGLFEACHRTFSTDRSSANDSQNDAIFEKKCQSARDFVDIAWGTEWVPGLQVIFVFALLMALSATVILDLYLVLPLKDLRQKPGPPFVVLCFNIATFGLGTTGATIVFVRQSNSSIFLETKLDWAFRLSIAAKTFFMVSLMLLLVEYHRLLMAAVQRRNLRQLQGSASYELSNMDRSPAQQQQRRQQQQQQQQQQQHRPQQARGRWNPASSELEQVDYPTSSTQGARRSSNKDFEEEVQGAMALPLEPRGEPAAAGLTGLRREKMRYY